MAKMRVYQLAKELHVQSALILELLDRLGQDVKSDLSVLDANTTDLVRERVTRAIAAERERLTEERKEEALKTRGVRVDEEPEAAAPVAADPKTETIQVDQDEAPAAQPTAAGPQPETVAATAAPAQAATSVPGQIRKPRVFPARRLVPHPSVRARAEAAPKATPPPVRPPPMPQPPPGPARSTGARTHTPPPPRPRRRKKDRNRQPVVPLPARPRPDLPPVPAEITLSEAVTVKELAEKLNRKSKDVIAKLIPRGVLATINQPLDPQMAIDVALEFGSAARVISFEEEVQAGAALGAEVAVGEEGSDVDAVTQRPEDLVPRPPVVTVMGHVDHGKTSLLDAIRATNVVDREAGGITQHIGAYQVEEKGRKITFLDTPGHEAFTLMRSRGSKVTDIVILVVAAEDGVKPQTIEAIDHARAADVPIVVAINKIDKPNARPDRVKQQLAELEVVVEEYGGDTVSCEVSAKQRIGIDELLDMVLLVADLKDLKANPARPATGVVLETRLDRARGIVASVLIQDGTLQAGSPFIAGSVSGKVRAMVDERGHRVQAAGPSTPVEVIGFADEPTAGDAFQSVADEAKARQIASFRREKILAEKQLGSARRTLESLSREAAEGGIKELPIILKSDSHGSGEALQKSLEELPSDKVRIRVIRSSIGGITRADVLLASASDAIVVGFNVRPDRSTAELAKQEKVQIRLYSVIYDLLDEVRQAMVGLLEPISKEIVLGQAEVRQLFKVPKLGTVAGCMVGDGKIARNSEVRLIRDNVVIYTGKVGSLRRFKDDVSEVKQGTECGIGIAGYNDLQEGDLIEFFVIEKTAAKSL